MFIGYVINLNHRTDRLHKFNQHPDARLFERIAAIDKEMIKHTLGNYSDFLFNPNYVDSVYSRKVTVGEIACTLSHIQCWKKIISNDAIGEEELILIAEDDVSLCDNFFEIWQQVKNTLQPQAEIDIVILQRLLFRVYDKFNVAPDKILGLDIYSSEQPRAFDDCGSSLYAIRKSKARAICSQLLLYKPHWLADNFGQFCQFTNIRMVYPFLAHVEGGLYAESDLEPERNNKP